MAPCKGPRGTTRHRWSSITTITIITTIILALVSTVATAQRVPGAAVYFPMAWQDCRSGGSLPDAGNLGIGGLRLNSSSLCHPAGGVGLVNNGTAHDAWASGSLVYSTDTFTRLQSSNAVATTVDIWFTPAVSSTPPAAEQVIFAINRPWQETGEFVTLALIQNYNKFALRSTQSEDAFFGPTDISVPISTSNTSALSAAHVTAGEDWTSWRGTIHSFAIYTWNLTASEVQQNYQARVPNSRPLAINITRAVKRNGEVGTHYDTPEFYLEPVPVLQLPTLALRALDADEDPGSPNFNASEVSHSIRLTSLPTKGTLYFLNGTEITAAPTPVPRTSPLPGDNHTTPTAYVRYRPMWGDVSAPNVYTSFTFIAVDGVTGLTSDATAAVRVIVEPTHDLPVAQANVSAEAMARVPVVIPLNGTASGGASVVGAYVARLPQHGSLYQVNASDGSVALAQGPIVLPTANGSVGAPLWGLAVAYVYTGPQNLTLAADGTLAADTFAFRVRDNLTAISLRANVSITVRPSIEAMVAQAAPSAVEGQPAEIVLYAADASRQYHSQQQQRQQQLQHALCFEITALPRHGWLLYPDTAEPMDAPGVVLQGQPILGISGGPYAANATVLYQSASGFFNVPRVAWDGGALEPLLLEGQEEEQEEQQQDEEEESFTFRVVICDNPTAASLPVSQNLQVVNQNDPTEVVAPASHFTVLALGSLALRPSAATTTNSSSNSRSGTATEQQQQQQQQQQRPDLLVLTGWTIDDPDRGVDPVVVRLEAQYGILRLNAAHLSHADFTSSRFCHARGAGWTCQGSGEDRVMVFVTSPQNLCLLLEGLEYQCTQANVVDTVTLTIFDGEQPEADSEEAGTARPTTSAATAASTGRSFSSSFCLPRTAFNNTSDRSSGCLVTTASFTVAVGESAIFNVLPDRSSFFSFRSVPTSLWMAAGALGGYFLLVGATCVWRARRRRVRVGAEAPGAETSEAAGPAVVTDGGGDSDKGH